MNRIGSGQAITRAAVLCGALLAAFPAQAQDSLRCGSRVITTGAVSAEVLAVCGEPVFVDQWANLVPPPYSPLGHIEEWYYDFGPSQLVRILHFRNGRLSTMDSDGYGFARLPDGDCRPQQVVQGQSKYRLLALCGDPVHAEMLHVYAPPRTNQHSGDLVVRGQHGRPLRVVEPVFRERWVYNFGPRYLQRHVTLENGRVVRVENGPRGF